MITIQRQDGTIEGVGKTLPKAMKMAGISMDYYYRIRLAFVGGKKEIIYKTKHIKKWKLA
jgi:hypothetical protein